MRIVVAGFALLLVSAACRAGPQNDGPVTPAPIPTAELSPAPSATAIVVSHESAPIAVAPPRDDLARCRDPRKTTQSARERALLAKERRHEVADYIQLKTEQPTDSRLDEVLSYLALTDEQLGDIDMARRTYFDLIRQFPSSKYIPYADLGFGEVFFEEAQSDPAKRQLAAQAFQEAIKFPPPKNGVYAYALFQHARASEAIGDGPRALADLKKSVDATAAFPEIIGGAALATAAREELVRVYVGVGNPEHAYHFFRTVSGDAAGTSDGAFQMMASLAYAYMASANGSHFSDAATTYRDLAARDAAHACKWRAHISFAESAAASRTMPPDATLHAALSACP